MPRAKRYRDVPPFLRDGSAAFRWAKRHLDLDEYAMDTEDRAALYSDFAHDAYNAGRVQIYRAILIRQNGRPHIRFDCLGKAWSRVYEGAGVYNPTPAVGNGQTVVLTGIVNPYDIDWEYGFASFVYYGEDQWEVSLLPKTPVLVTHIDDDRIEPVKGSSGTAGESWMETC